MAFAIAGTPAPGWADDVDRAASGAATISSRWIRTSQGQRWVRQDAQ
jgi:hypothetical protein